MIARIRGALALALGLTIVSGCGLQGAGEFIPEAEAGTIRPVRSLEGVQIAVGSKSFTEQQILGKLAAIALSVAGAEVTDLTGIAGSVTVRDALVRGEVDLYWEYTGTGWIAYLQHTKPVVGERQQWEAVKREDLAKNHIVWLPPAPLNNTYAMAVTKKTASSLGVKALSDLAKLSKDDLTFCVASEFATRDDGLLGMLKTYGIPLGQKVDRGKVRTMDEGVIYDATARGRCNFGEVFTSDGRIKALGLEVLVDDKKYFPNYNAAVTAREELVKDHPEIEQIFAPISEKLTTEAMQELNAKVDQDGEEPALVARDWLRREGFIR